MGAGKQPANRLEPEQRCHCQDSLPHLFPPQLCILLYSFSHIHMLSFCLSFLGVREPACCSAVHLTAQSPKEVALGSLSLSPKQPKEGRTSVSPFRLTRDRVAVRGTGQLRQVLSLGQCTIVRDRVIVPSVLSWGPASCILLIESLSWQSFNQDPKRWWLNYPFNYSDAKALFYTQAIRR